MTSRRNDAGRAPGVSEPTFKFHCNAHSIDFLESIEADFLAGKAVRVIDFPGEQRPAVIAAIAVLRDRLPVRVRWQTVRESHVSETRLRARVYRVADEFLRVEVRDA